MGSSSQKQLVNYPVMVKLIKRSQSNRISSTDSSTFSPNPSTSGNSCVCVCVCVTTLTGCPLVVLVVLSIFFLSRNDYMLMPYYFLLLSNHNTRKYPLGPHGLDHTRDGTLAALGQLMVEGRIVPDLQRGHYPTIFHQLHCPRCNALPAGI